MASKGSQDPSGVNLSIIITPMLDMAFQLLAFFVMTYHPSGFEGHYNVRQTLPPEKKLGFAGANPNPNPKDELPADEKPKASDNIKVSVAAAAKETFLFTLSRDKLIARALRLGVAQPLEILKAKEENELRKLILEQTQNRSDGEPAVIRIKKPETPDFVAIASIADKLFRDGDQKRAEPGKGPFLNKLRQELQKLKETAGQDPEIELEPDSELKHEWVMNIMGACRREGFKKISFREPP